MLPLFTRSARAQTVSTFDYYISPTGSNSNAGTLASPWAITALNSKGSTYAGKNVGILPGNYSVYSLCQAGSYSIPALNVTGGTSSSPTFVGSSNAAGVYTPRTAILDAHSTISAITAISQGATTTVTVNSSASSNPFTSGDIVAINGVAGMTQINGLYLTVGTLGGSSGAWTFTVNQGVGGAALNSSGFSAYTGSGWASQGYPSTGCAVIGQGFAYNASGAGYATVDGFVVTGPYQYGIAFYFTSAPSETSGAQGAVMQNCEIWDIAGNENANMNGAMNIGTLGALIHNCKIHQVIPTSGNLGQEDCCGIQSFSCHSNIYEYNTIYNTTVGIYDKNGSNGNHTYRYNYIEQTTANVAAGGPYALYLIADGAGGNSGDVMTVHHNILIGSTQTWDGTDADTNPSNEGLLFYNNTVVAPSGAGGIYYTSSGSGAAVTTHYNNIYDFSGTPGFLGILSFPNAGAMLLSNYNAYNLSGSYFGYHGSSYTLANWQSKFGWDANSVVGTASFVSATSLNPTGYQLNSGSVGQGTGRVGGTAAGAACDMGAWGYDPLLGAAPTQIGCSFASVAVPTASPVPNAPVLTVS